VASAKRAMSETTDEEVKYAITRMLGWLVGWFRRKEP
jgi:hypothetical protein